MGKKLDLEARLRRDKEMVAKYALRHPKTWKEVALRKRWDRLNDIIWRRYDDKLHHPTDPNMSRVPR
jgi:hypothetical protein